jgi:hypothetical protein
MRSSCGCGCLVVLVVVLVGASAVWFAWGVFDRPRAQYEVGGAADGRRAQQKLFGLATGKARSTTTLTEREINALLARHISTEQMPLADLSVHLIGNGVVEITGRVPLHGLAGDSVGTIARILPERWGGAPVWLHLRGHVRLESGGARDDRRRLRLDPESVRVGRRRLPVVMLTVFPEGPVHRATRWPVPAAVDTIVVEPGRVTITTKP